ncbi:TAXI family TRAP transporter solute-binding subunit [Variovorax sp. dw_954]|uniref:TAXI family TRAP transporter solute-binding subunit n=1 Tax=Variovorax sp. dw_954 TaxID=2720078 RepID=UPI001BD6CB35|nr:TAXI family TRAP transporter solute-binding subunit [Variovorax sp. dw_954]
MHMPRALRLFLLTIRDLIVSVGPVIFIVIGLLIAAYWYLDPQPPKTVVLATGPQGSAYAEFGKRYQQALAASGIKVELKTTEGALDNLALLRSGGADVAFVRGGAADAVADEEAGITSLGSLFYEPVWVFYREEAGRKIDRKTGLLTSLAQLKGLRVNVDKPGSGVPQIMDKLFAANHMDAKDMELSNLDPAPADAALQAGLIDVVVLASAPQSPLVRELLRAPNIKLMPFDQGDAYARRFAFLSPVALPRGVVTLDKDIPPHDVALLAATTSLLSREQTHPALRQLFAQTAQKLHGEAGWFNRARDFPNTRTSELPVSPEGDRAINGTPPFWQRYLPFWASNLVERMWLVIGGLIVLMLPLSKVVPPLYTFRVRSRVFRWYARLREVEAKLENGTGEHDALLKELDDIDRKVNKVAVPLSYADELYALRNNIFAVRKRVLAARE